MKHISRLWILIFKNFCTFRRLKFIKLSILRAPKTAQTAVIELLDSPKLISRKIWMTKKSWNFYILPIDVLSEKVIGLGSNPITCYLTWPNFVGSIYYICKLAWQFNQYSKKVSVSTFWFLKNVMKSDRVTLCVQYKRFSHCEKKKFRENWNSSEI